MNICAACVHSNAQVADQMLRDGASQATVARFLRLDRQVVGRHVRKGHVVRGNPGHGRGWSKPEPKPAEPSEPMGYVYSADEVEAWAQVDAKYLAALAATSGVDRQALEAHWSDVPTPEHDEAACDACRAIDASQPMLKGIEAQVWAELKPAPGWTEPLASWSAPA